ncbi:hypothetical protein F5B20DRAFT_584085 [Whalleya microplaca]|nr:hypothetical protein F5B20DRAFT_584085 [Whalleya microplaca]
MASTNEQNIGAVVELIPPKEGSTEWVAKQIDVARNLPPGDPESHKDFHWNYAIFEIQGWVDVSSLAIFATVSVLGINIGTINGNLNDGVSIKVDLKAASGEIRLFLKNGHELWVGVDVKVIFGQHYHGEWKIIDI